MLDPNDPTQLKSVIPNLNSAPADTLPPTDREDVTTLDEDHLRGYILNLFRNDIQDKQDYGWIEKKDYAIRSYFGLKNEAMKHWPWEGASCFPVPLTPTILDTAWANIQAGIFGHPNGPIKVPGIQNEDIRPAKILEKFLNWQAMNDMELETESDKNVFRSFLMGTGIMKVMFDLRSKSVKVYSIDLENFFVPIDATGLQKNGTDHIIQIIPLSYNDVQIRKGMKIYRDADSIIPGIGVNLYNDNRIRLDLDKVSGMAMDNRVRRDNYYIAEVHLTYVPKNSYRPQELIVWMSPNGGVIQRIRRQERNKRPFADAHVYLYPDRFYSMGIPEKIRNVQEKLDYSDKQYTDAMDRANNPAAFVDDTEEFDRTRQQRVPGGIYPKGKGNTIDWEPQPPVERGFSQERVMLWEMAERLTGVIDVTQGRPTTSGTKTLGEVQIRASRADVRFSSLFKRFGDQYKQVFEIIYELDHEYMPKDKIERVIGYQPDGYSLNEIFPLDKEGNLVNYNFGFSGSLIADKESEMQRIKEFYAAQIVAPAVVNNPANWWRASKEMAEAMEVRDFESVIERPKEAEIMTAYQFIERLESGQRNLIVRPGIDTESYLFELQLFMKSDSFQHLDEGQKTLLMDTLRRVNVMSTAQRRAQLDLMLVKEKAKFGAIQNPEELKAPQMNEPPPPISAMVN